MVVSARGACYPLFEVGVTEASKRIMFFLQNEGALRHLMIFDKHTVQYAAFSIVDKALRLTISEEKGSKNAGNECNTV